MNPYGPQGQPGPYGPQPPLPPQQGGQPYPPQQWPPQPYGYQPPGPPAPPPWASKHNGFGIAGLVVGIVALVSPVAILASAFWLGLVAVILSGVGLTKAKIGTASNRGMSMAGMTLGLLAMALAVVLAIGQSTRPTQAEIQACLSNPTTNTADEIWACTG